MVYSAGVIGAAPGKQRFTKTDGKLQDFHAQLSGYPEMAVFVHRHQDSDGQKESNNAKPETA